MSQRHSILLFSLLITLMGLALLLRSIELEDASERLASFPKEGAGFSSRDVPLTDFEKDMLGDAKGYKTIYQWKGVRYVLTVLDGTRNRQAVHDPRYCFRGAGWAITADETIDYAGGTAHRLKLGRDGRHSEALFFYSTGEAVFSAPLEYWLRATLRRWLRTYGGAEPVLVMVQPVEDAVSLDFAINGLLPLLPRP